MNTPRLSSNCGACAPEIPAGTHLSTRRRGYLHHGVYVGLGEVVHFRRPGLRRPRGRVVVATFEEFSRGGLVCVESSGDVPYSGMQVVIRARSRVGEPGYSLLRNNCEHFSNWCVRGVPTSSQVERVTALPAHIATGVRQWAAKYLSLTAICAVAPRLMGQWPSRS